MNAASSIYFITSGLTLKRTKNKINVIEITDFETSTEKIDYSILYNIQIVPIQMFYIPTILNYSQRGN